MNIDKFKPMTVYTIYIASTPEKVWEALTSAEFSRKYFFGNSVEIELKVGGAYIAAHAGWRAAYLRRGDRVRSAEQVELHLQRQLARADRKALGPTLVTYEIESGGDAVRLTMTEFA